MTKSFCFSLLLINFFLSCNREGEVRQEFVSYNTFNIQPQALQKGDSLKLIYSSSFNNKNDPFEYLIQVVAIKLSTKDTVNILCTHTDQIERTDGDKVFKYEPMDKDQEDLVTKSDSSMKKVFESDSTAFRVWKMAKLDMVILDPKYTEFDNKNYPTVFGEIKE
jgi:hypothetical protein